MNFALTRSSRVFLRKQNIYLAALFLLFSPLLDSAPVGQRFLVHAAVPFPTVRLCFSSHLTASRIAPE